jgi:hypothetical protein
LCLLLDHQKPVILGFCIYCIGIWGICISCDDYHKLLWTNPGTCCYCICMSKLLIHILALIQLSIYWWSARTADLKISTSVVPTTGIILGFSVDGPKSNGPLCQRFLAGNCHLYPILFSSEASICWQKENGWEITNTN